MALTSGTKLGPYEIESPLGAGGMGEVYRAKDTRLDRTVAVKILPSHLSDNPEAKQRFDREARAISSLNHPNICTLYDVGHQDGTDYLVMEFLEGETLADRLKKGPLTRAQALDCAIDICEGLEKAHRGGVVHRDLKPGNIMLTKTGATLMDFGLAKAVPAVGTPSSGVTATMATPAGSSPLTAHGTVVGTFQYMSPEQVEGKDADARSDIFAFGAVLYEMTTGKRAFQGKSTMSIMSAILERDPEPISTINPLAPPLLDHIVRRSLAKNPEERWQSAQDLKLELEWIRQAGSQTGTPVLTAKKSKLKGVLVLSSALLLAAILLALGYFFFPSKAAPAIWANLDLSGELMDEEGNISLSPDGQKVAYVAATPQGSLKLWVRNLASAKAQPLEGTDAAEFPFWSPDSHTIAFFAGGKLKRIDASGEGMQSICDAGNGRGGSWNRGGTIVFAPNIYGGLLRVGSGGGTPAEVTHPEQATRSHRWPTYLPDGRHFLFVSYDSSHPAEESGVYVGSLDSGEVKLVSKDIASNAVYVEPGYLLYVREGKLKAQRFDLSQLRLSGDPISIAESVRYVSDRRIADFSAMSNLLMLLPPNSGGRQLVWFDREGHQLAVAAPDVGRPSSGSNWIPLLSPDGSHALLERNRGNASDIWIYDLKTAAGTRLTFSDGFSYLPIWSPDGRAMAYTSSGPDSPSIHLKPVSSGGADQRLEGTINQGEVGANSFSPDGRFLAFTSFDRKTHLNVVPLFGDRKPFAFPRSQGATSDASFSPDGKYMAYVSDESGRSEVYVVSFPGPGGKWQISTNGASRTWWVGHVDTGELLYLDNQARLVSVPVRTQGADLSVGDSQLLLGGRSLANTGFIDITRDGKRILLSQAQPNADTALTLVMNWAVGLKK
ncbi:MAG: protein kinase [Candidatus Sulfotelmatobacter sp.]|jgi:serine/threonine protein kinase